MTLRHSSAPQLCTSAIIALFRAENQLAVVLPPHSIIYTLWRFKRRHASCYTSRACLILPCLFIVVANVDWASLTLVSSLGGSGLRSVLNWCFSRLMAVIPIALIPFEVNYSSQALERLFRFQTRSDRFRRVLLYLSPSIELRIQNTRSDLGLEVYPKA